jgi:flagellar basal-body rod modification protein FlgD
MNALVSIRENLSGLLGPTSAERVEAAKEGLSSAKANLLGKSTDGATIQKMEEAEATQENSVQRVIENELDRDAFLQLLVLQMQNQDPLEPTENSEMIAQLAQFSSLEQMENLNSSFEDLSGNIDQLNFINANGMIGRTITGISEAGTLVQGEVESVQLVGSVVQLVVDGQTVSMAGVLTVA